MVNTCQSGRSEILSDIVCFSGELICFVRFKYVLNIEKEKKTMNYFDPAKGTHQVAYDYHSSSFSFFIYFFFLFSFLFFFRITFIHTCMKELLMLDISII